MQTMCAEDVRPLSPKWSIRCGSPYDFSWLGAKQPYDIQVQHYWFRLASLDEKHTRHTKIRTRLSRHHWM